MNSTARILVVDDESGLWPLLRHYLSREGFTVIEAENGLDALSLLPEGNIDLALVDVRLPKLDGFELVRRIRQEATLPSILLTTRGEEASRVAGLELGADDYVVKLFSAPEAVARVRAQLRPANGSAEDEGMLQIGPVELDRAACRRRLDGREVELTRREFDLLAALMEHADRARSRDELLELAWGTIFLAPTTVDVHIALLRGKLGASIRIEALRGVGYWLAG